MTRPRVRCPLAFAMLGVLVLLASPGPTSVVARAEEAQAAPDAAAPEAPAPPQQEPERISGKLHKIDADEKSITILVEPVKGSSARGFKRYKLVMDDKSLILVDNQPSTFAALESGQRVDVGYFKKGKKEVVDTVVVTGKAE